MGPIHLCAFTVHIGGPSLGSPIAFGFATSHPLVLSPHHLFSFVICPIRPPTSLIYRYLPPSTIVMPRCIAMCHYLDAQCAMTWLGWMASRFGSIVIWSSSDEDLDELIYWPFGSAMIWLGFDDELFWVDLLAFLFSYDLVGLRR